MLADVGRQEWVYRYTAKMGFNLIPVARMELPKLRICMNPCKVMREVAQKWGHDSVGPTLAASSPTNVRGDFGQDLF